LIFLGARVIFCGIYGQWLRGAMMRQIHG